MTQCIGFPKLDLDKIKKLQELEDELDILLLAVDQRCNWAELSEDQIHKLREAEDDLGVILLAYKQ